MEFFYFCEINDMNFILVHIIIEFLYYYQNFYDAVNVKLTFLRYFDFMEYFSPQKILKKLSLGSFCYSLSVSNSILSSENE